MRESALFARLQTRITAQESALQKHAKPQESAFTAQKTPLESALPKRANPRKFAFTARTPARITSQNLPHKAA